MLTPTSKAPNHWVANRPLRPVADLVVIGALNDELDYT
jgi:hypothetical protein